MSNLIKSVLGTTAGKGGLAGIAISVGTFFVKNILRKKGVSTNIKFIIESILYNKTENRPLPEDVIQQAQAIEKLFDDKHVMPDRIAIDGTPGCGKSTLAKALGQKLNMKVICLDHQDMDVTISFVKAPVIYEHHRLLRTQNIDCFDAIIYIDQPVEMSMKNILKRERGAYLVDIMNFDLLKRIGQKAFSLADGEEISITDSFARVKIRPGNGYNVMGKLSAELREKGMSGVKFDAYNKEQKIFLCEEGEPRKGFAAYVNPHAYEQELLAAVIEGVGGSKKKKSWD
nr:(d)CMP kinase [Desulfobulbaceae bacterium]